MYYATAFVGYVGALTVMKPGKFSITVDSRFDDNYDKGLLEWVLGLSDAKFLTFMLRDVIENTG